MYMYLKALHIIAVLTWISTMLAIPAAASQLAKSEKAAPETFLAIRTVFNALGTPSMFASLALGLWMAKLAGFFDSSWLAAKLVLVIILAGLHGVVAGRLRRTAESSHSPSSKAFAVLTGAIGTTVGLVVFLVVLKPG